MTELLIGSLITAVSALITYIFKKTFKDLHNAHAFIKLQGKDIARLERNQSFLMDKILTLKKRAESEGWKFEDINWKLEEKGS